METSPKSYQLLSEDSIKDIPEAWFNHLNEVAKALKIKIETESISAYSKPIEIEGVQTQILSKLADIPDQVLQVNQPNYNISATTVRNIFCDYLGIFGLGALTITDIDRKYKLPDRVTRKVISTAIKKLEAYKPIKVVSEYDRLTERYDLFIKLANDLAIPTEAKGPEQLSREELKEKMKVLSLEIIDLLKNTDIKYLTVKHHNTHPETIRDMLIDHYGLENIEEPRLSNGEIAIKYGLTSGRLAYNLMGKAINILKKYYGSF